ncbi:MAG: ABC transporter substrate-binding protein [Alphaproteobacteria bacterium]
MAKNGQTLRVLGTRETLLEPIRRLAERDLGLTIEYEITDGTGALRKAVTKPGEFDVCHHWHPVELAWTARSIQAIDLDRIDLWAEVGDLAKTGRLNGAGEIGQGSVPVRSMYVQPNGELSAAQTGRISTLPTVHNVDSFGYDPAILKNLDAGESESWSWLLDDRWRGKVALLDEPGIGSIDAALAVRSSGLAKFTDIGNMSLQEIDTLVEILIEKKKTGHFAGFWSIRPESVRLMDRREVVIESIWSPAITALRVRGKKIICAAPIEGYRGWQCGMWLSAKSAGASLDAGYAYLNWWLTGPAGAIMARQGYYMSALAPTNRHLSADEWGYWYEGKPANNDMSDPDGQVVVRAGEVRDGGSYWQRMSNVAVWNSVMDEHNYLVRRWNEFLRA